MATAEFLFDFASPNAYLAHRVLPQIEARTGVKFSYTPVLLGGLFKLTGNQMELLKISSYQNERIAVPCKQSGELVANPRRSAGNEG